MNKKRAWPVMLVRFISYTRNSVNVYQKSSLTVSINGTFFIFFLFNILLMTDSHVRRSDFVLEMLTIMNWLSWFVLTLCFRATSLLSSGI